MRYVLSVVWEYVSGVMIKAALLVGSHDPDAARVVAGQVVWPTKRFREVPARERVRRASRDKISPQLFSSQISVIRGK